MAQTFSYADDVIAHIWKYTPTLHTRLSSFTNFGAYNIPDTTRARACGQRKRTTRRTASRWLHRLSTSSRVARLIAEEPERAGSSHYGGERSL
eukprot:5591911-Amphidinium_carterae.10